MASLKLSSALAPPASSLGVDPAKLTQNSDDEVGNLPDFRGAFSNAVASVRAAMTSLDRETRSVERETASFLRSQHQERQQSLDLNLRTLSTDLVLARRDLSSSVDGWLFHLDMSGARMASDFESAASAAKRSLRERKDAYDRDLDPVIQERASLISRIIEGEQLLYDNSRAASDAMENLRQNPQSANLEDVVVRGIDTGWSALDHLNEGPSGYGALLTTATKEAIIEFVPGRADLVKQKIADNYEQIANTLIASFRCIPCKIDSGIAGIAGFVYQVAELGPRQVDELLASSLSSLNETVASLRESALEAGESADENLVAGHDGMRDILQQTAEAEEDAEAAQASAQVQAIIDRLEANRDALPASADGIRQRLIETAEAQGLTPIQFAQQAMESADSLLSQVAGILESEPDLAQASILTVQEALIERAVEAGRLRSDQLDEARSKRREAIAQAGEGVSKQVRKAMSDLRPITKSFAETAENFLPDVDEGYTQAVQRMHAAIDQAGYAVDVAMTGTSNRSPGGGGEEGGDSSTAQYQSTERSTAGPGAEGGDSQAERTPAPQPPPPETCDGCGGEETNQSIPEDEGATSSQSSDATSSSEPNTGTSDGSMSVDPGMSMPADPLSPTGYADRMRDISQSPMTHDVMEKLVTDAKEKVPGGLTTRGSQINTLLDVYLNADIDAILGKVEGITATHGQFFERFFGTNSRGWGLRRTFRHWVMNELSWPSTMDAKIKTFNDSLDGDVTGAAINRLTAAMVGWNDSATMESVMNNLTPSQLEALRAAPPSQLKELRSGMNREELERFNLMMSGGAEAVRATELRREVDRLRWEEGIGEKGGQKVMEAIRTAEQSAGSWAAEADAGRQRRDLFELEHGEVQQQRSQRSFRETETAFAGLRGVSQQARRGAATTSEDPGSTLMNYATASRDRFRRVYDERLGHYTWEQYTQEFDPEYARVIEMGMTHGFDSEEALAAELYAETHRSRGDPRPEVMQRVLQPSGADAVRMGGYNAQARESGLETAEEKRRRIFALYAEYSADSQGMSLQDAPSTEDVQAEISGHINSAFEDDANARDMMNGWVNNARGDPVATMEYAIANENFDVARTQLSRMDRTEIDALMRDWNTAHPGGPSFEEAMGLGEHRFSATDYLLPVLLGPTGIALNAARGANYNWSAAFSGDEANELELLMNGVPQNEYEAGHIAQRTMDMQIEQSTFAGQALAYREYSDLVENANRLRIMMGTDDIELDSMGRITATDPTTGQPVIAGNFNPDGSFDPPEGTTAGDFNAAMGLARFYSDNYTQAVDRVANYIATAIVMTAAIVTTFLTGGAAASIWIPMLVTMGAGVLAMGTTMMIKGNRYSKDQMLTDLATNIVSAATAGLGGAATVYLRGAATAGQAGGRAALGALSKSWRMSEEALSLAVRGADKVDDAARLVGGAAGAADDIARAGGQLAQPKMWQNMVVGGLSGGASGATAAAMDPRFKNSEDYWSNVAHGFGRGFLSGAAGAGITEAAMRGGGQILNRLGRDRAQRLARQMNISDDEMAEFIFRNAEAFSSRGYMDILNRSLSGGLSGSLSKGLELGYDRFLLNKRITAATFAEEMFWAGLQNAFQSSAEGVAEGARRRFVKGDAAEHRWNEDQGWAEQRRAMEAEAANDNAAPDDPHAFRDAGFASEDGDSSLPKALRDLQPPAMGDDNVEYIGTDGLPAIPRFAGPDDSTGSLDLAGQPLGHDRGILEGSTTQLDLGDGATEPQLVQTLRPAHTRNGKDIAARIVADLTDPAVLAGTTFPARTEIIGAPPTDHSVALRNYHALRAHNPKLEVGLAFNVKTGQYAVVQGAAFSVHHPQPAANWVMKRHAHPTIESGDPIGQLTNILPSGIGADVTNFVSDAILSLSASRMGAAGEFATTIDVRIGNQDLETVFRVTPREDGRHHMELTFYDPRARQVVKKEFSSAREYAQFAAQETGNQRFLGRHRERIQTTSFLGEGHPDGRHISRSLIGGEDPVHQRQLGSADRDEVLALATAMRRAADSGASMRDFDDTLKALGLVGDADSMIRLHAVINDETIDIDTRRLLSDQVLGATRRDLVERGELSPGEPLLMLFHGATDTRARSIIEGGIDMSRRPGGATDDFADGLYVTQHLESAFVYTKPKGPSDREATGAVVPYIVRGRDLGEVVDVSPGGAHRAAFERFVQENSQLLGKMRIKPSELERIMAQPPGADLPFGTFDGEARGILFQAFLDSLGGPQARPDIVFGDLGGTLTSGRQFAGGATDQAAVKSTRLAEVLNQQHVRSRGFASEEGSDASAPKRSWDDQKAAVTAKLTPKERALFEAFDRRIGRWLGESADDFRTLLLTSQSGSDTAMTDFLQGLSGKTTPHWTALKERLSSRFGFELTDARLALALAVFEKRYRRVMQADIEVSSGTPDIETDSTRLPNTTDEGFVDSFVTRVVEADELEAIRTAFAGKDAEATAEQEGGSATSTDIDADASFRDALRNFAKKVKAGEIDADADTLANILPELREFLRRSASARKFKFAEGQSDEIFGVKSTGEHMWPARYKKSLEAAIVAQAFEAGSDFPSIGQNSDIDPLSGLPQSQAAALKLIIGPDSQSTDTPTADTADGGVGSEQTPSLIRQLISSEDIDHTKLVAQDLAPELIRHLLGISDDTDTHVTIGRDFLDATDASENLQGLVKKVVRGAVDVEVTVDGDLQTIRVPVSAAWSLLGQDSNPLLPFVAAAIKQARQDDINELRNLFGYSDYGEADSYGTIALATDGTKPALDQDQMYLGVNNQFAPSLTVLDESAGASFISSNRLADLEYAGATEFKDHAEFHAILAMWRANGGDMPDVVELYVDRIACGACRKHLESVRRIFGIPTLVVHAVGHDKFGSIAFR
ncbi:hypothetical protein GCM10022213_21620 [Parerythrobacter jejuensis]